MAILLNAENLSMSYDSRQLFEGINLWIDEGEKVGLIGPNAAGKSTLLKIAAGLVEPDSGQLVFRTNTKVSYLEQDPQFDSEKTILQVLHESNPHLEPWQIQIKAEELIWQLGLSQWKEDFETKVNQLSGGWKKRVAILRALLAEPDLILLDEPTNHLDIEGILWLEKIISLGKFASITITHDRVFLQRVSTRILELDRRNPNGLLSVKGNYQDYLSTKEAMLVTQQGREASLRSILRRETEWLKAGVKAQRSKQSARIQRHSEFSEELSELSQRNRDRSLDIEFQAVDEAPKRLLEAKRIFKSFSPTRKLFSNLDIFLGPKTRLGIIGENGCGKSTLLRVLLGEERPDSGHIFRSELLKAAYFEQNRNALDPKQSLLRSVCPYGDSVFFQGRQIHIRSYLDRFMFTQEQLDLPISKLSGGEQSRVLIAKLMLIECNLLVLDEPTNDLDIMSLNILQDCLSDFEGAVVLVSHDRYFLDQVSNQILAFPVLEAEQEQGHLHFFSDIAQWEAWHQNQIAEQTPKSSQAISRTKSSPPAKKDGKSQRELQQLTRKIEQLEKKYVDLETKCSSLGESGSVQEVIEIGETMSALQKEIDALYARWESLETSSLKN